MIFSDERHKKTYYAILAKMHAFDAYHASYAYLISLIDAPAHDCFDFQYDKVKRDVVNQDWVSGTDFRVLTLALNLWNPNNPADVSEVFSYVGPKFADYLFEAIKIRFEHFSL